MKKYSLYFHDSDKNRLATTPEYNYPGRRANDCFILAIAKGRRMPGAKYNATRLMTLEEAYDWLKEQGDALVGENTNRCLGLCTSTWQLNSVVPFDKPLAFKA